MSEHNLNMVQFQLNVPSLMKLAKRVQMPPNVLDMGYLAHCCIANNFGDKLSSFKIQKNLGRFIQVLAFSDKTGEELRNYAETFSTPESFAAIKLDDFFSKPMPKTWRTGLRLAFEISICPIRRKPKEDGKSKVEVDAFFSHCRANPDKSISREEVYRQWLAEKFEKSGGATLISAEMKFLNNREQLVRRTQGADRKAVVIERPSALFRGVIEVKDEDKFNQLLRRGIGRHRKFGFGMLLLKPIVGTGG